LLADYARRPEVVQLADSWKQLASAPAVLPAVQPDVDTYGTAGRFTAELDAETTAMLLGEVPAAFHAGTQDILLIAFALAWAQHLGRPDTPIGIDVEGHGRQEELGADLDLSRTVGWFTAKYPVSLTMRGLSWAQVVAGDAALAAVLKDAKEQLRSLPDGLTYGLLRYLNAGAELGGADPAIGFNYLGRLGASSDDGWQMTADALSLSG
ncbi:condensation domain-containing protein, partial [Mycolicibacterium sp. XJ2546]